MKTLRLGVCVFALALVFNIPLHANGKNEMIAQFSPITDRATGDVVGLCEVIRDRKGLSFKLRSIAAITPGEAYTVWGFVDDDLDENFEMVFRVAGGIGGPSGEVVFEGRVAKGKIGPVDGESILKNDGDGKFNRPLTARLRFRIRSHGPIQPDQLIDQVSRFNGGCAPCVDIQNAVVEPPGN